MNEKIRLAEKNDIPALCEIWEKCFSDSREYIELFYKNNFERIKIFAYCEDGKPVSMLHLIDADLIKKEKRQAAKFIYATGTLPNYRKNGCMSALIKFVTDLADKDSFALFLKPSSPAASKFYKSFGFEEKSALNIVSINPADSKPLTAFDLSFIEYNRMRETAFNEISHIKWDDAHIKWCVEENEYFSGKTLGINYDNKEYFLMGYPENNELVINETDLSVNQLNEISASLCDVFGTKTVKAYMPVCDEGDNYVSVLLYNLQTDRPYINMIMI